MRQSIVDLVASASRGLHRVLPPLSVGRDAGIGISRPYLPLDDCPCCP